MDRRKSTSSPGTLCGVAPLRPWSDDRSMRAVSHLVDLATHAPLQATPQSELSRVDASRSADITLVAAAGMDKVLTSRRHRAAAELGR